MERVGYAEGLIDQVPLSMTVLAEMAPLPPMEPPKPVLPASAYGRSGYIPGQCVWGVATWKRVPDYMGSAYKWDEAAKRLGFRVLKTPFVGAVAQHDRNGWGHVALVLDVRPGQVLIREMNWNGPHSVRVVWLPSGYFDDYIDF